jgi:hypothetical protein
MTDIIRCFECVHFKGKIRGWCHNPVYPKKERVDAIDYCDKAEKKEADE